jgi:hypothetical protein
MVSFARPLRCSSVTDFCEYAPPSRLASGQNPLETTRSLLMEPLLNLVSVFIRPFSPPFRASYTTRVKSGKEKTGSSQSMQNASGLGKPEAEKTGDGKILSIDHEP